MMNDKQVKVYGGIDTHADTHHLAVIDQAGRRLADAQIPTTALGTRQHYDSWVPGLDWSAWASNAPAPMEPRSPELCGRQASQCSR